MDNHETDRKCCQVLQKISSFLKNECMSDVTFTIGQSLKRFPCHKFVLGASSQVFRMMFYGEIPESDKIHVPDITETAFDIILRYIYTDSIHINTSTDAFEVGYASKKYMLHHLFQECEKFLISEVDLTSQNVIQFHEQANFLDMEVLKTKTLNYIARYFPVIFQSEDFPPVSKSTIEDIVKMDILNVNSEADVLDVLGRWTLTESQDMKTIDNMHILLKDLIKHVRFSQITAAEFNETNKKYNFFSLSEEMSLLMNMCLPRSDEPLKTARNFDAQTRRRSVRNSDRIKVPLKYHYSCYNNKLLRLQECQQTTILQVKQGTLTILGFIIRLKPFPEYSPQHRYVNVEVKAKNESTKTESEGQIYWKVKGDRKEETCDLLLNEFLLVSDGERLEVTLTIEAEGVKFPRLSRNQIFTSVGKTNVLVTFVSSIDSEEAFCVSEIMCV